MAALALTACSQPNACNELRHAIDRVYDGQASRLESALWRGEVSGPRDRQTITLTQEGDGDFRYYHTLVSTRTCLGADWREVREQSAAIGWSAPTTHFEREGWPIVRVFDDDVRSQVVIESAR